MLWDYRHSAAVVKVMSVPDSWCIRMVTPDDHVNIVFHEILLHDMGEEELAFGATSELDYLRRIWPWALFAFMSRYQQDLERMRKKCRERFGCTQSGNCTHCGKYTDLFMCTVGTRQGCMVSPFLFALYINELVKMCIQSNCPSTVKLGYIKLGFYEYMVYIEVLSRAELKPIYFYVK